MWLIVIIIALIVYAILANKHWQTATSMEQISYQTGFNTAMSLALILLIVAQFI